MRELESLAALGKELAAAVPRTIVALESGMAESARMIQKDAQNRIGEYQREVPPFPAWDPLAPGTIDDRVRQGYAPDEPLLRRGDLRESIEAESNALEAVVGSRMPIAAYQEFGTVRIPPRPFIGPAAISTMDIVCKILAGRAVLGLTGVPVLSVSYGPLKPKGSE